MDGKWYTKICQPRTLSQTTDIEAYLTSDVIAVSQKFDGRRLMIIVDDNDVIGISRSGDRTNVPEHLEIAFSKIQPKWVFDGELVGNTYHVFDLIHYPGGPLVSQQWTVRQDLLKLS